jgi:hypothetical protein
MTTPLRRLYVDSSAYIALLTRQKGAAELEREFDGAVLLSCALLLAEFQRTIVHLSRSNILTTEQYQHCIQRFQEDRAHFVLRKLTDDILFSSVMPVVSTPKILDLIHVRCALWFHSQEPIARFVTMDAGQRNAARELGLPV